MKVARHNYQMKKMPQYAQGGYNNYGSYFSMVPDVTGAIDTFSTKVDETDEDFSTQGSKIGAGVGTGAAIALTALGVPAPLASKAIPLLTKAGDFVGGKFTNKGAVQHNLERRAEQSVDEASQNYRDYLSMGYGVNPNANLYRKGGPVKKKKSYPYGGNPNEYEVEKDEVVQGVDANIDQGTQIASDLTQVNGQTHEQGGVIGTGGERIYSDRIKVDENIRSMIGSLGIKINPKATYGEAATKLGKMKGEFEKKNIYDTVAKTTAEKSLQKIGVSLDLLYKGQEEGKMSTSTGQMFKYGGRPKYAYGNPPSVYQDPYKELYSPSFFETEGMYTGLPTQGEALPKPINPPTVTSPPTQEGNYPAITLQDKPAATSVAPSTSQEDLNLKRPYTDALMDNMGHLVNTANYVANLGTIKKLKMPPEPIGMKSPVYVDYLAPARDYTTSAIKSSLNTANKAVKNQFSQTSQATIGSNLAKALDAINSTNVTYNSGRLRDLSDLRNRIIGVDNTNKMLKNQFRNDLVGAENLRDVAYPLNARNTFLQGFMGNEQTRKFLELDRAKMALIAGAEGSRNVTSNMVTDFVIKGGRSEARKAGFTDAQIDAAYNNLPVEQRRMYKSKFDY